MFNNPNIIKLHDSGVFLYKNFITQKDRMITVINIENLQDDKWTDKWPRVHGVNMDNRANNFFGGNFNKNWTLPIYTDEMKRINFNLKDVFGDKYLFLPEFKITRMINGQTLAAHKDHNVHDTEDDVLVGYVAYFNDFEGGEISYPEINFTYQPQAGDLILHYGSLLHEVLPIKQGPRYTIAGECIKKEYFDKFAKNTYNIDRR